jgi:hypothetical protein
MVLRDITTVTQFIQEVSIMLDLGKSYSLSEVEKHIENKDVIDWLEKEFPMNPTSVDFSLFQEKDRAFIHNALESVYGGYAGDERRKWGLQNNGLCLLISWATEIARDVYGQTRE